MIEFSMLIYQQHVTLEETTMHPRRRLKNEGSMVQTCRNINVHEVTTDIC